MEDLGYLRSLPKFDYMDATTVGEACSLLSKFRGKARVIAGGTDLLVAMRSRKVAPQYIINIKTIAGLDYIRYSEGEGLRIGALAVLRDIGSSPVIRERFPILGDAASKVGDKQIQNVATIGGNICNAAPSADTVPSLIVLGAKAKIEGVKTERVVALEEFFVGPSESVLEDGEMLTEIQVPNPPPHMSAIYLKLPARTATDIAAAGVAVAVTLDSKHVTVSDAKIALGAVAPTPIRARKAEDTIKGKPIQEQLIEKAAQAAAEEAKPISDLRGPANYRREMVKVLAKQAIRQAIASA